ncbi:MAG: SigB/SigF/SigG family RNA polymerase sigma factor [Actinomycetota bacterium]
MQERQGGGFDHARTRELFARLPNDPSAREELVRLHLPLVEYLARRFRGRGEPLDDLIQVASLGLLKAIDRFDPAREVEFSTYATPTIIGELKRYFRDKGWALRVPRRLQEIGLQLAQIVPTLTQELGRSPSISEIAERSGFTVEEVVEATHAAQAYTVISLDAPTGEDGADSLSRLGSEDEALELFEAWSSVAHLLEKLPSREREILYLRFVAGETQSSIAAKLGISQMHVSRLLARTLAHLRQAAEGGEERS